jgi:ribosome-binding protein aMBF1 (putative translation factor)
MNKSLNEQFATEVLSPDRFDEEIDKATSRNILMSIEYDKNALAYDFAHIVRQIRDQYHLTQNDLAQQTGVPQSFISRLENPMSDKEPSLNTLSKIMSTFGRRIVISFEEKGNSRENSCELDLHTTTKPDFPRHD